MKKALNAKTSFLFVILLLLLISPSVFAASSDFLQRATQAYQRLCTGRSTPLTIVMSCYAFDKIAELQQTINNLDQRLDLAETDNATQSAEIANLNQKVDKVNSQKRILNYGQVRGSFWELNSTSLTPTPDFVNINCSVNCVLWVNFDVDTRNKSQVFQHIYHIFIDNINQAVFNQVTITSFNAAYPLALNGVFPVSVGDHKVSIYVQITGGTLQQHESHLQVLAIEQ